MSIVYNALFIIKFNAVSFAKELRNLGELMQNPCLKATHLLKHVLEKKQSMLSKSIGPSPDIVILTFCGKI